MASLSGGVPFTARSDSPARLRSARARRSAASIRPRGPSPVSRNEASSVPESARTSRMETIYPLPTPVTSPSTIALAPSRIAISRASVAVTRTVGACCIRPSAAAIVAGDIRVNADEPASPARTASLTTRPSVESTLVVRKSVRRIGSCLPSFPAANNEPNGPIPSARNPMNRAISTVNVPSAYMPPRAVWCQLIFGAALSAIVAIVPCAVVDGLPPGVKVGVIVIARRVTRWT